MPEYRITQEEQLNFLERLEELHTYKSEDWENLHKDLIRAKLTTEGFDHSRPIQSLQDGTDTVYYQ